MTSSHQERTIMLQIIYDKGTDGYKYQCYYKHSHLIVCGIFTIYVIKKHSKTHPLAVSLQEKCYLHAQE